MNYHDSQKSSKSKESSKPVIVHLNYVFANTVLEKRMEYAFDTDGSKFWERFFLCDDRHPNEKIIYLFTQPQLIAIDKWLKDKGMSGATETENDKIKKNLDQSRENFFNNPVEGPAGDEFGFNKVNACYMIFGRQVPRRGYYPKVEKLGFSASPPHIKRKSVFFGEGFIETLSPTDTGDTDPQKKVFELVRTRQRIDEKFHGPKENDTKWLRYLGPKFIGKDHPSIGYCVHIDFPLVV